MNAVLSTVTPKLPWNHWEADTASLVSGILFSQVRLREPDPNDDEWEEACRIYDKLTEAADHLIAEAGTEEMRKALSAITEARNLGMQNDKFVMAYAGIALVAHRLLSYELDRITKQTQGVAA